MDERKSAPQAPKDEPVQESSERTSPFALLPGYKRMQRRRAEAAAVGIIPPFFFPHDHVNGAVVDHDGREYINYSGYNYVGLSGHPEVSQAAKNAIDRYGTSVSASRIVSGQIPLHLELERAIADFLGVEAALTLVSGYGTNVTAISHLTGRHDLVIHDSLAHNSIVTGCQLSAAKRLSFPHNDWDALDAMLSEHRGSYRNCLILIESVYSMDGDIADLPRAIEIKRRHNAWLMVDEAHSLGVLGATGAGIGEHFGVDRRDVDIWMGTLSKSLASCGGYIAGDRALTDYMSHLAPGFLFSVGLSPADTAAALAALNVMRREPERVARLRQRSEHFLALAREHGFDTGTCEPGSPVVPLIIGDSYKTVILSNRLLELGVHVQPIISPAVAEASARLRFFITAMHTEEQIAFTVGTVARELASLNTIGN